VRDVDQRDRLEALYAAHAAAVHAYARRRVDRLGGAVARACGGRALPAVTNLRLARSSRHV